MNDLLCRLDQIEGVIQALESDVRRLEKTCFGLRVQVEFDSESAGARRHYVRAVFALIEAVVEQHKCLLLDLWRSGVVSLDDGVVQEFSREKWYVPLQKKIVAVYNVAGDAFGQSCGIACEPLRAATDIRNRLTHPKTFEQCQVSVLDLDKVKEAEKWFRDLNHWFVRVAEQHRAAHGNWRPSESSSPP